MSHIWHFKKDQPRADYFWSTFVKNTAPSVTFHFLLPARRLCAAYVRVRSQNTMETRRWAVLTLIIWVSNTADQWVRATAAAAAAAAARGTCCGGRSQLLARRSFFPPGPRPWNPSGGRRTAAGSCPISRRSRVLLLRLSGETFVRRNGFNAKNPGAAG